MCVCVCVYFFQLFFPIVLQGRYFYPYSIDKDTELGERISITQVEVQGWALRLGGLFTSEIFDIFHSSIMSLHEKGPSLGGGWRKVSPSLSPAAWEVSEGAGTGCFLRARTSASVVPSALTGEEERAQLSMMKILVQFCSTQHF